MTPLSERLATLSARAKQAEDGYAAAKTEAHDKLEARRDQTRTAVETSMQKVGSELRSFGDETSDAWRKLEAKVNADTAAFRAGVDRRKHEMDVHRAENRAEDAESEAAFAIDYALASIDQAELAVVDAILARVDAEEKAEA